MRAVSRIVYFACFVGLALVAALALNRVVGPSMATILTRTVVVAAVCAAPGLFHRRLWPLAVILVPIGCYLLLRTVVPVSALVEGAGGQYHFYTEQLHRGALIYRNTVFPLAVADAPELKLLIVFTVYWLLAVAGFVSLSLRRPLAAVVLLLVLVGFSATVDTSVRALWPTLLFIILAACLFVLSRGLKRTGWRLRDLAAGGVVGAMGALLAFLLLSTSPSVAAPGWYDWRTLDFGLARTTYSFNWLQNYPRLLDPGKNMVFMRVESAAPSYWRANALDNFTGSAWVTSQAFLVRLTSQQVGNDRVYSVPATEPTPPGKTVEEVFSIESVYTNYLFIGGDPQSLMVDQDMALRMNNMRALRASTALGPTLRYSVTAVIPELVPNDLVGLGTDYPGALSAYLTLPFGRAADIPGPDKQATWRTTAPEISPGGWEWVDLYDLNSRIVRDATDPYQITLRIERYLRQFYTYSLTPPASDYSSPYAAFLFDTRLGYCQHFAGAMAVLLRFNGIPSRVAVGFTSGEADGAAAYVVSTNNAHAWVEVYFPTQGWVAFDPTPGRSLPVAGASSTSPGFINPFVDESLPGTGTVTPVLPREDLPETGLPESETGGAQDGNWLSRATWLPWVIGIVVVIAGWPVARGLWRRRRLHRGTWEKRLQASLRLLRSNLSEYGAPVTAAQTLEEVLLAVRTHLALEPDLEFIDRAEAVLFGGRSATPRDVEQAEALRRKVGARLRGRHGWVRTGLTWYGLHRLGGAVRAAEIQ